MRILLDTVAFIHAVNRPDSLSKRARSTIASPANRREISSISLSEIAIKQTLGKLDMDQEDVLQGLGDLDVRVLPWTAEHAFRLFGLPLRHADPFDRQIIAQALAEDLPVVTSDSTFHLYRGLKVIW